MTHCISCLKVCMQLRNESCKRTSFEPHLFSGFVYILWCCTIFQRPLAMCAIVTSQDVPCRAKLINSKDAVLQLFYRLTQKENSHGSHFPWLIEKLVYYWIISSNLRVLGNMGVSCFWETSPKKITLVILERLIISKKSCLSCLEGNFWMFFISQRLLQKNK